MVGKFCVILQSKDCFCFVKENQKTSALWIAYSLHNVVVWHSLYVEIIVNWSLSWLSAGAFGKSRPENVTGVAKSRPENVMIMAKSRPENVINVVKSRPENVKCLC